MTDIFTLALRAGAIVVGLALWFWTQKLISTKPVPVHGIGDRLHEWATPVRDWLAEVPRRADVTLIVTSGLIDLFGLYLIAASLFGPTMRPFLAMLTLFALRQLCQALFSLPRPPGMIWRHPGVPSLLVTYNVGNDFFFKY